MEEEWDERKNNERMNLDKYKQLLPMLNNIGAELGVFKKVELN